MTKTDQITHAARIIASGGVIAHPTEGVFGLACDPNSDVALERVMRIKERDRDKGVILMAHSASALQPFCAGLSAAMIDTITAPREHPTTFIVPAADVVPELLSGGRATLAVRVTQHPLSRALCKTLGHPIVSTSANRGGQAPARDARTVQNALGDDLDMVVDGPLGGATGPSAIIDIISGEVIRAAPQPE